MKWHKDPAHGWLEIPKEELNRLNLQDEITAFSYHDDDKVYLEEDCDADKYLSAFFGDAQWYTKEEHLVIYRAIPIKQYKNKCSIRKLDHYGY